MKSTYFKLSLVLLCLGTLYAKTTTSVSKSLKSKDIPVGYKTFYNLLSNQEQELVAKTYRTTKVTTWKQCLLALVGMQSIKGHGIISIVTFFSIVFFIIGGLGSAEYLPMHKKIQEGTVVVSLGVLVVSWLVELITLLASKSIPHENARAFQQALEKTKTYQEHFRKALGQAVDKEVKQIPQVLLPYLYTLPEEQQKEVIGLYGKKRVHYTRKLRSSVLIGMHSPYMGYGISSGILMLCLIIFEVVFVCLAWDNLSSQADASMLLTLVSVMLFFSWCIAWITLPESVRLANERIFMTQLGKVQEAKANK